MTKSIPEPFALIHGLYSAKVIFHLHKVGALERFKVGSSSGRCRRDHFGYDRAAFQAVVDYVSRTTDVLMFEPPDHYRLNDLANFYGRFGFPLDKFYRSIRAPPGKPGVKRFEIRKCGEELINHRMLATAFHRAGKTRARGKYRDCDARMERPRFARPRLWYVEVSFYGSYAGAIVSSKAGA